MLRNLWVYAVEATCQHNYSTATVQEHLASGIPTRWLKLTTLHSATSEAPGLQMDRFWERLVPPFNTAALLDGLLAVLVTVPEYPCICRCYICHSSTFLSGPPLPVPPRTGPAPVIGQPV